MPIKSAGSTYNPALDPNHGEGLFFAGVEGTGMIYAYALNHSDSSFVRVASLPSGQVGMMGLQASSAAAKSERRPIKPNSPSSRFPLFQCGPRGRRAGR